MGKGLFFKVCRAEHMSLGNEVALKILNSSLAQDDTFVVLAESAEGFHRGNH